MTGSDIQAPADFLRLALPRSNKVVLVLDLVESVRLINADEAGTIGRWHDFVHTAQTEVLPRHHGRLVKSLGDGLMVEFERTADAVKAAFALHGNLESTNAALPHHLRMQLRAGINSSLVYTDSLDIYGAGVNLAARLATLAGPGETVIPAHMRDDLADGLDADVDDLGECYLKHIDQPVRVYRVGPAGSAPVLPAHADYGMQLQPTVAVIPFESRSHQPEDFAVGELIADSVITQLSRAKAMRVISRLSSTRFRGRGPSHSEIRTHLSADFVLSGSYLLQGERLVLSAELVDLRSKDLIWADRISGSLGDLLSEECEFGHRLASVLEDKVLSLSLQRVRHNPLPTVAGYSLMLAGVGLMHQSTRADFELSRKVLEHLLERHARFPNTRAWLAQWHVLRTTRGLALDIADEGRQALEQTRRALDADPGNSLALAMEGFVYCHLKGDLGLARERLAQSCDANPNEALAWLFQSVVSSFSGDATHAVQASERAMALSPLDPLRYYYESLAASSALSAGDYQRAKLLCESSLRKNRTHASTLRALITALVALGEAQRARDVGTELLKLAPQFTVDSYRRQAVSTAYPFGKQVVEALLAAGLPAH